MSRFYDSSLSTTPAPQLPLAGIVLIASPKMQDELFGHSVCLVLEHDTERSIGFMLNRPFSLDIAPIWKQMTDGLNHTATPPSHIHFGGPQSGPVIAIHDREALAEAGNGQGIYLAAQVDTLKKLALVPPDHYRLLVGHTVWQGGVLEQQVFDGLWYALPATPQIIFAADDEMWLKGMKQVGRKMIQSMAGIPWMPDSPQLN